jgi:hypothetical protein
MSDQTPTPSIPDIHKLLTDLLGRLNTLEQKVEALQARRPTLASLIPYTPPTEEELHDMLHGPRGQPLLEVIEEYEKKYLGR